MGPGPGRYMNMCKSDGVAAAQPRAGLDRRHRGSRSSYSTVASNILQTAVHMHSHSHTPHNKTIQYNKKEIQMCEMWHVLVCELEIQL